MRITLETLQQGRVLDTILGGYVRVDPNVELVVVRMDRCQPFEAEAELEIRQALNRVAMAVNADRFSTKWYIRPQAADEAMWAAFSQMGYVSPVSFLAVEKMYRREAFTLRGEAALVLLDDLWRSQGVSPAMYKHGLNKFRENGWELEFLPEGQGSWLLVGAGEKCGLLFGKNRADAAAVAEYLAGLGVNTLKISKSVELARATLPVSTATPAKPEPTAPTAVAVPEPEVHPLIAALRSGQRFTADPDFCGRAVIAAQRQPRKQEALQVLAR